jgi:hypothetical protein
MKLPVTKTLSQPHLGGIFAGSTYRWGRHSGETKIENYLES